MTTTKTKKVVAKKTTAKKTVKRSTAPKIKTIEQEFAEKHERIQNAIDSTLDVPVTLNFNDPKIIAKIKAYSILKEANLDIPEELAVEVEAIIAAETKYAQERLKNQQQVQEIVDDKTEKENNEGPLYIRNGYPSEQYIRLERQEEDKRKIKLNPRGQRGDIFPLQDGDEKDPAIKEGLRRGLIEIIRSGDAQRLMEKQTENIHTQNILLSNITNSEGKQIPIEISYGNQGVVVAVEDPNIGSQHENIKWGTKGGAKGGLIRLNSNGEPEKVTQFIPTGGNPTTLSSGLISDGYASNASLAASDAIAKQKNSEGISAGVAGLTLTVAPTQKG